MISPRNRPDAADTESPLDPTVEPESHVRVKPETLRGKPFTEEVAERIIARVVAGELTREQAREEIIQAQLSEARLHHPEEELEGLEQMLRAGLEILSLERQPKR